MSRRLEVALVLLFAMALAAVIWAGRRGAGDKTDFDFRASTLVSGPEGSRALYDVLARLRVPVERRRTPLFDFASDSARRPAMLVVLDPPLALTGAELDQVARFVREGGAVVAANSGGGITSCVGWRTAYRFFLRGDSLAVVSPDPALTLPAVTNYLKPPDAVQQARRRVRGAGDGGNDSEEDHCDILAPLAQDTLLRLRDGRPAALRMRYPRGGSVTLVADAGYFRNRTWRDTDVPEFVTPLLVPTRRGAVVWDEYHQGFGHGRSLDGAVAAWLRQTPIGWAVLQVVAVLVIGLAVAGVRFGPARSAIERRRRSPLEHLEALAAGLEGAAGVDTAVALTVSSLRRRLGRAGMLAPEEQRAWLTTLELALPTAAGRNAVRRLQRILSQPGGSERALAAAQAVEDVWLELRPAQTPVAS
ncbi:MAG TPA: DUF4350 domain-containing protein [Gemmatimonadales bacterium]|nr:DUF4350 domain-containing protein [Gemmatimonadales bacterium]